MLNVIFTYPQLHSILHCFIKNCILLQQMHKIHYCQSVWVTFLHTLLKFQLSKAKLYSQYTPKTLGTDFSLLGKPISWESQIHNRCTNNSKEQNVPLHKAVLPPSILPTFSYLEIALSLCDSSSEMFIMLEVDFTQVHIHRKHLPV